MSGAWCQHRSPWQSLMRQTRCFAEMFLYRAVGAFNSVIKHLPPLQLRMRSQPLRRRLGLRTASVASEGLRSGSFLPVVIGLVPGLVQVKLEELTICVAEALISQRPKPEDSLECIIQTLQDIQQQRKEESLVPHEAPGKEYDGGD